MHIENDLTLGQQNTKKEFREISRKVKESVEEAKKRARKEFNKKLQSHFNKNAKVFWKK
jgi:hypothetical protein